MLEESAYLERLLCSLQIQLFVHSFFTRQICSRNKCYVSRSSLSTQKKTEKSSRCKYADTFRANDSVALPNTRNNQGKTAVNARWRKEYGLLLHVQKLLIYTYRVIVWELSTIQLFSRITTKVEPDSFLTCVTPV